MQPLVERRYYVYALICKDTAKDSIGYIKIGYTSNIGERLSSIKMSCPIPARYYAVVDVRGKQIAERLEKALHDIFSNRRAGGEWFRFDMSCGKSKQEFNRGCQMVFREVLGPKHAWWTTISVQALDAYNAERRKAILHSKHRKRIIKDFKRKTAIYRAWKEMSVYRDLAVA